MTAHHPRILVVEDDPVLARSMVDLLHAADCEVDGPYADASDGMAALAEHFPDGAVLDLHRPAPDASLLKDDLEAYDIPFLDCVTAVETGQFAAIQGRSQLERRLLPWLRRMRH